jgi:lactoylglutathione lyase
LKIAHIAIWVKDLERTKTFYEKYFNARSNTLYINKKTKFKSYFLSFGDASRLELMQMPTVQESPKTKVEQETGFSHLAISVGSKEEVIRLTNRLANDGYEVLKDPRYTGDGYYESLVLDPEKNRIEITV